MIRSLIILLLIAPCITRAQPLPPGVTNLGTPGIYLDYAIKPWDLWLSFEKYTPRDPSHLGSVNTVNLTLHGCEVGTTYKLLVKQKLGDSLWLTNSTFTATNINNPRVVVLPPTWTSGYFMAYGLDRSSHWRMVELTGGLLMAAILGRKLMQP